MPYIETKTNLKLEEKQKRILKEEFGRAIELIPGKSEEWLMLSFVDGITMAFRGESDEPAAMIEVALFGRADSSAYDALTEKICQIVEKTAAIPSSRIYVTYTEHERWGYNGFNL